MLLSNLGNKLSYAIRRLLDDVPRLQVPRFSNDGSVLGGIMEGRAFATNEQITNQAMKEHAEELAKAKAEDEMMRRSLFGNGNKNNTPQFNIGEGIVADRNGWRGIPQQQTTNPLGEGIVADRNGWRGIPQQQTTNPLGIDTSGWGNPSGNSINVGSFNPPKQNAWTTAFKGVKSFNQPSADNPLAQAVEGLGINPNYMSIMSNGLMTPLQQQEFNEKMNLRQWLEWDAKMNGVTDPLISLARYNKFMPTMQKQAELEELRNAYYIMNSDPNDKRFTPEQRLNARTLVEFDKKNPYYVDDHDMSVERFGWDRQNQANKQAMLPYQLEGAQIDLENKKLGVQLKQQQIDANELMNSGEYAGVNLEGDSWYRKNDGVDLSNLQGRALAGLNHASVIFKSMFREPLMVTSGRDSDAHMGGKYSHYTGWKVDVSSGMNSKILEDPQERARFILALNRVGIIVNDEWGKDKHLDLNFQNYHGGNLGNRLGQKNTKNTKNTKETETPYDSLALADAINATYTEGKTRGTDAERALIGKMMSGAVDMVASPYDNWQTTSEKLYDYYHNKLGASKGWTLNSEEFSHLVGRAIHDYYLRNTQTDIPVNMIAQYVFNKFDPESKAKQAEAEKWKEENKNAPKSPEEQARKVLGVTSDGSAVHTDATPKKDEPKKAGSKTSLNLDEPITLRGIMSRLMVGDNPNRDKSLTWQW